MRQAKAAGVLGAALLWISSPAAPQTGPKPGPKPGPAAGWESPAQPFVPDARTLALLDRSGAYLAPPAPDGRRRLVTNGGHKHVLMARVGPDGEIETYCADSVHAAQTWGAAPPLRARER